MWHLDVKEETIQLYEPFLNLNCRIRIFDNCRNPLLALSRPVKHPKRRAFCFFFAEKKKIIISIIQHLQSESLHFLLEVLD